MITSVLKSGKRRQKRRSERCNGLDSPLIGLNMEEKNHESRNVGGLQKVEKAKRKK